MRIPPQAENMTNKTQQKPDASSSYLASLHGTPPRLILWIIVRKWNQLAVLNSLPQFLQYLYALHVIVHVVHAPKASIAFFKFLCCARVQASDFYGIVVSRIHCKESSYVNMAKATWNGRNSSIETPFVPFLGHAYFPNSNIDSGANLVLVQREHNWSGGTCKRENRRTFSKISLYF